MHIKDACKKFDLTEAQLSCLRSGVLAERQNRQPGEIFTFGVRTDTLNILRYRDTALALLQAQMEEHIQDAWAGTSGAPHEAFGKIERWQFVYISLESAHQVERKLRETCYTITTIGTVVANAADEA